MAHRQEQDNVVLLDFWPSSNAMRVKIALAEKGIAFECKQEDLQAKSSLLLEKNPVNKMIPVLIHNGKPICESLNIVQYIDDPGIVSLFFFPLILTRDPKPGFGVYSIRYKLWKMKGKRKEQEEGKKEFIECLKRLEGELGEKAYFGGEKLGYVDVALVPFTSWFYTYETLGDLNIEAECPKLVAWAKRCMESQSVAKSLPHPHNIYEFAIQYRKRNGLE